MGALARRRRILAWAALAALVVVMAALPSPAMAGWKDNVNEWLGEVFSGFISWEAGVINSATSSIVDSLNLDVGIEGMFGEATSAVWTFVTNVMNGIAKPIAATVLTLCVVLEMVKISQHVNSSQVLPGVGETVALILFFVLFDLAISNAEAIVGLIYNVGIIVLRQVSGMAQLIPSDVASSTQIAVALGENATVVNYLVVALDMAVVLLGLVLAYIASTFMVWGRALQIYVMVMFAPVPIALLGAQETRQMGIGFFKNFAALCLAGAIMVFSLYMFDILFIEVMGDYAEQIAGTAADPDGLRSIDATVKLVALCILLIFALTKSGAWARDVFGG